MFNLSNINLDTIKLKIQKLNSINGLIVKTINELENPDTFKD